jgi:hypothetical protein
MISPVYWLRKNRRAVILSLVLLIFASLLLYGYIELGNTKKCSICHEMRPSTVSHSKSNHANVSCLTCHFRKGALGSVGLGRLYVLKCFYSHLARNYTTPLNREGDLYKSISSSICTRCHPLKKEFTPRRGILINHEAHAKKGISCTECHNRVSHDLNLTVQEIVKLKYSGSVQIRDRMQMDACMECHTGKKGEPPSRCDACHPQEFRLPYSCASCHENLTEITPQDHFQPSYEKQPHARSAKANLMYCLQCHTSQDCDSCHVKQNISLKLPQKRSSEFHKPSSHFERDFMPALHGDQAVQKGKDYCFQCHKPEFCDSCHRGIEMPHPEDFKVEHGKVASEKGFERTCIACHKSRNTFCESGCHHKGWDPSLGPLAKSHPQVVKINGVTYCLTCHTSIFCAVCHVSGEKKQMFRGRD